MTDLQRRRVHLLMPDATASRVLVTDEGSLPVLDLEFPSGTTGTEVVRVLRSMGIDRPLLDCYIDATEVPDDVPNPVVVHIAAPDPAPHGWRWSSPDAVVPPDGEQVRRYALTRLAEFRGAAPVPPERSPWALPGWFERAHAWIDRELEAAVGVPSSDVIPYRMWGISAVFRVPTAAGDFWLKAVCPHFAAEPRITARLAALRPGAVPAVVAVEPLDGWMLMRHLDGVEVNEAGPPGVPLRALAALQQTFVGRLDELFELGLPDRRLPSLAADLHEALALPEARAELDVDDEHIAAVLHGVRAAVERVTAIGVPDTLVHGDFHPNNVALRGDAPVVFDWSDAAVGCPLVDVGAWGAWLRDDPVATDELWSCWAEAWAATVPPAQVLAARPAADAVVAAYHVVSYAHIVRSLEPLRRAEVSGGIRSFFADLVRALDRT